MRTRLLLGNIGRRAMITPGSPLRSRLIHICPSYRTIYRLFEIIPARELSID